MRVARFVRPRWSMALLCVCCSVSGVYAAKARLDVGLEQTASAASVRFTLTNIGETPVSVLKTGTPLEESLSADVFDIRRASKDWPVGSRAIYAGRIYKRGPPTANDFLTLAPGASRSAVVDLQDYYQVYESGEYRVAYRELVHVVRGGRGDDALSVRQFESMLEAVEVVSPSASVAVELQSGRLAPRARPPNFSGCSAQQQTDIVEATAAAEDITNESLISLDELAVQFRANSPRYSRWFGRYTVERYETVTNSFRVLLESLSGATLNFDCTCDEAGVFAFVFPFQLHDVFLCPQFFGASVLGTDSRAGTIVYELSHFEALVGTEDNVYGQNAAAVLADNDPDGAIDNADNVEYFAENTPFLPMRSDDPMGSGSPDESDEEVPGETTDQLVNESSGDSVPPAPRPTIFMPLELDVPLTGLLNESDVDLYTTDNADAVSVTSDAGDADLYVFTEASLAREALYCTANAFSDESITDTCELVAGTVYYLAVVGYLDDTRYGIVTRVQDFPVGASGEDPVPLDAGASDTRVLSAASATQYRVRRPVTLSLTSLGGNADLYVFADGELTSDRLLCVSNRAGDEVDRCELAGEGSVRAVVYQRATGGYRLSAVEPGSETDSEELEGDPASVDGAMDAPPALGGGGADLDPVLVNASSDSNNGAFGIGSVNGWFLLAVLSGFRWRRRNPVPRRSRLPGIGFGGNGRSGRAA